MIAVKIGHKNGSGDWIVDDTVETNGLPTISPQIYVTNPVDEHTLGKFVLTHFQSGCALLWGFPDVRTAQYVAGVLSQILPIDDWDAIAEAERGFMRNHVNHLVKALPARLRAWIKQWMPI